MPRLKDPERAETEARLQQAIAEYKKRQKQVPKDSKSSLQRVVTDFNISRHTLKTRINGRFPRNKAHEELMHLTIQEERELAHWITTLIQHDYAPALSDRALDRDDATFTESNISRVHRLHRTGNGSCTIRTGVERIC